MNVKIVAVIVAIALVAGGYFAYKAFIDPNNPGNDTLTFVVDDIQYTLEKQDMKATDVNSMYFFNAKVDSGVKAIGYTNDNSAWVIPSEVEYSGNTYPVKSIGKNAFSGSKAETVTIGSNVGAIESGAFSEMKSLKQLTVNSDTNVGDEVFKGTGTAEGVEVILSEGVTQLPDNAFKGMIIASVSLPSTIETLNESALGIPNLSDGEVFIGWYSNVMDLSSQYNFRTGSSAAIVISPIIAESADDYSNNELTYVIQYKYNRDFTPMSYEVVNRNHVPEPPIPTEKEGYVFAGWFTDATYTEKYNVKLPIRKDTTLYGKYVETEKGTDVVIRVNYGEGHGETSYAYKVGDYIGYWDQFFQQVLNNVGSKDGFTFKGLYQGTDLWYDNGADNTTKSNWSHIIVENTILDAKWESTLYDEYDPQYVGVYNGDFEPNYLGKYSNLTYDYYTYYVGSAYNTILKHGTVYRNDGTTYIELTEEGTDVGTTISSTYTRGSSSGTQTTTIEKEGGVDGWGIASGALSSLSAAGPLIGMLPIPGAPVVASAVSIGGGILSGLCGIISAANNDSTETTTVTTSEDWSEYTTGESTSQVYRTTIKTGVNFRADVGVEPGHYVTYAILGTIDYYQIEVYDKQGHYVGTILEAIPTTNDESSHGITVPDKNKSSGPDLDRSLFEYQPIPYKIILEDSCEHQELKTDSIKTTIISRETGETLIYENVPGRDPVIPNNSNIFKTPNGGIYGWAFSPVDVASSKLPTIVSTGELSDLIENPTENQTYYAVWEDCNSYALIQKESDFNKINNNIYRTYYLINNISIQNGILPIKEFQGTFYGNNHTITGFTRDGGDNNWDDSVSRMGLFELTRNAKIMDLVISNSTITINVGTGQVRTGVLIGNSYGTTTVTNCTVFLCNLTVNGNNSTIAYLGGLIGFAEDNTSINNCTVAQTIITGSSRDVYGGGLTGVVIENASIGSGNTSDWNEVRVVRKVAGLGWGSGIAYAGGISGAKDSSSYINANVNVWGYVQNETYNASKDASFFFNGEEDEGKICPKNNWS